MMDKFKNFFNYIYWLGAKVQYKHFGEKGTNGIFVLCAILLFLIADTISFFRVLYYDHKSYDEIFGGDYLVLIKFCAVSIVLLIWYLLEKIFKNVPIKNHSKFRHIPNKKRIFHTVLLYLFWVFLFYVLLVIYSPDFHPRQLKFW